MRQLVQSVRSGELTIVEAPDPLIGPTEVLVQTTHSLVSAGTERAVRELASASLLQKAKARPDLVRRVLRKAREDGIRATTNAVRARLDDDMPLGYSGAGVVLEVGEAVAGVRPGMRVATGGAGHGELQVVAGLLAVPIPDDVTNEQAAFATVASIALHGLRLADVGPGGSVCVVGLGLIGQLTVRLALASGLRVFGVDLRDWKVDMATSAGASGSVERGDETTRAILEWSRGHGVDAVLLTAATSSSDPVQLAPSRLRDRGTVVVVGDVGLDLKRTPLYEKEISLKVARSYGPGRYERAYEDWAVDYPVGQVRFTEGRNLASVMDLMAMGRLDVEDLITHRFAFDKADQAYSLLADDSSRLLGVQLTYAEVRSTPQVSPLRKASSTDSVALIGAGAFTKGVLVPSIQASGLGPIVSVSSASGATAARLADRIGATAVTVDQAIDDPAISIVVVATTHDTHAELTARALRAGKHVFCEKPLALSHEQLDEVRMAWEESGCHLAVGFNRRYSPDIDAVTRRLATTSGPLVVNYRINAGSLPPTHWYHDRRQGGRLIGEACHFVDTCLALVGCPVVDVVARGGGLDERLLTEDFSIMLAFEDGSTATISYGAGGHPSAGKERIEIIGRGHSIVVDDFKVLIVDGERSRHSQDKGHAAQFVAFGRMLGSGESMMSLTFMESMSVTLDAAASLVEHGTGARP
jgi:predicted dehydrogenase/threonine dehydrogenase-like Zn-dependent dehydrogenase